MSSACWPRSFPSPAPPHRRPAPSTGTCDQAGPQAPRNIDDGVGSNPVTFANAPPAKGMQICDVHFHKFAEHKASEFAIEAGHGEHAGFACKPEAAWTPTDAEKTGDAAVTGGCEGVEPGTTIEVHWVFTTCDVEPGPTLNSCFNPVCNNPQLRVEAQVFYLMAGEEQGGNFGEFSNLADLELPEAGAPVVYLGSTTGPSFSDKVCSPFQVTWSVRPSCRALSLSSLDAWCDDNVFEEDHAHASSGRW